MLEKELKTYDAVALSLLNKNPKGGYVVIKGSEILGIWKSRRLAMDEGRKKFGRIAFLVKSLRPEDNVVYMPNLFIGA